ncbi:general secretion pathway protein GspB [Vibrio sinaloensis]|uniref:general secretion pathway protein GspB n=1 Tax=Photobacterium sp. (strain ATCC 43367) TaxID=379097 RepID=UPI0020684169|nr:general secretion pathway protein GspB [Vibrio sinaloensis]UPQ88401.1 general secretion pathway protein GspB [Vibrio sinaloensis]
MSKVMQQLKHSEHRHLESGAASFASTQLYSPQNRRSRGWRYITIAIAPPLVVATGVALYTYQSQKQSWLESNVSRTISIEVPFEYQLEPAPDFGTLAVTYRQAPIEAPESMQQPLDSQPLAAEPTMDVESTAANSDGGESDLLQGIDLSELSPELAQRFEAALNSAPQAQQTQSSPKATNLSHHPEPWYGKLPAMNFQTHVYSSKADKRWVKINGVEYSEGDWINNSVELVTIEPQTCLIRFEGDLIEVPALYDWKG